MKKLSKIIITLGTAVLSLGLLIGTSPLKVESVKRVKSTLTSNRVAAGQSQKIRELQSALGIPQTGQWDTLTIAKVASLTPLSTSNSYPREVTRWIQRRVGVTADGWYGDNTANAVYNWQASHQLGRDGISGIETIQSLALA